LIALAKLCSNHTCLPFNQKKVWRCGVPIRSGKRITHGDQKILVVDDSGDRAPLTGKYGQARFEVALPRRQRVQQSRLNKPTCHMWYPGGRLPGTAQLPGIPTHIPVPHCTTKGTKPTNLGLRPSAKDFLVKLSTAANSGQNRRTG